MMVILQIVVIFVCSWEEVILGSFYSTILAALWKISSTESFMCIKVLLHLFILPFSYHIRSVYGGAVNNNLDQRKYKLEKINSKSKELGTILYRITILLGHLSFYSVTKWTMNLALSFLVAKKEKGNQSHDSQYSQEKNISDLQDKQNFPWH